MAACPTSALSYDAAAEVVRLDAEACMQCGACYTACPHTGAIVAASQDRTTHAVRSVRRPPRCVAACPTGCLTWVEGSSFSPSHYVIKSPVEIARSMALMYYPAREAARAGAAASGEEG